MLRLFYSCYIQGVLSGPISIPSSGTSLSMKS